MAKQRSFLILQSKCDFLPHLQPTFLKARNPLTQPALRVVVKGERMLCNRTPFSCNKIGQRKTVDFLSFELVRKFAPQNRLADHIGVLLDFPPKRLYRAFLGVTNRYSLFSLPVVVIGSFFRLLGAGVTLPLLISINSLTFCGTYFA